MLKPRAFKIARIRNWPLSVLDDEALHFANVSFISEDFRRRVEFIPADKVIHL